MSEWHLDKKVTIALIATMIFNTCATIYSAGKLVQMVEENRQDIHTNAQNLVSHKLDCESKRSATDSRVNSLEATVARIDERTKFTQEDIGEIKNILQGNK